MNASTINTIGTVLGLINPAIGVITSLVGSFSGGGSDATAKFNKVGGQIQDAASVIGSLLPLVQKFADGEDVTEDDVRAALADSDAALAELDRLIAAKGG